MLCYTCAQIATHVQQLLTHGIWRRTITIRSCQAGFPSRALPLRLESALQCRAHPLQRPSCCSSAQILAREDACGTDSWQCARCQRANKGLRVAALSLPCPLHRLCTTQFAASCLRSCSGVRGGRTFHRVAVPARGSWQKFGSAETPASTFFNASEVSVAAGKLSSSASALFELANTLRALACKCQFPVTRK
jgi:hypothetical protein